MTWGRTCARARKAVNEEVVQTSATSLATRQIPPLISDQASSSIADTTYSKVNGTNPRTYSIGWVGPGRPTAREGEGRDAEVASERYATRVTSMLPYWQSEETNLAMSQDVPT